MNQMHSYLVFGCLCVLPITRMGLCDDVKKSSFSIAILRVDLKKERIEIHYQLEYKGKGIVPVSRSQQVGEVRVFTKAKTEARRFEMCLDRDFIYRKTKVIEDSVTLRESFLDLLDVEIELAGAKSGKFHVDGNKK